MATRPVPRDAAPDDPPIVVVLPRRETVSSGHAGAVALTIAEYGRASAFRDRMLVLGGTARGDFDLPYAEVRASMWRRPWLRRSDRYALAVADAIRARRTPLVEVHNRGPLFRRIAANLPADTRTCLHLHNDPQDMEGLRKTGERQAVLDRAARVYCVSDYVRSRFVAGLHGPVERAVVLHNGVVLPPVAGPDRHKTILFVGRIIPEKGIDALLGALAQLAGQLPDWRVRIIGRVPERHRLRYGAALRDLAAAWSGRLESSGFLAHAAVMQAYREAAITLVPSLWPEPFGRVALEAMAAGSTVIASRSGGLPEIVGDAGVLLEPVSADTLAAALLALTTDDARRATLGEAGRRRARDRFAIALLADRLDDWRRGLLR